MSHDHCERVAAASAQRALAEKSVVPQPRVSRDSGAMSCSRSSRRDRAECGVLPDDLYVVPGPWPRLGRPIKHDVETWTVTDNRPERVPVTDAELDVFEAWFGDLFDELFGSCR